MIRNLILDRQPAKPTIGEVPLAHHGITPAPRAGTLLFSAWSPLILTDGRKTNTYRALVDPHDWTCGFISRAEVADFLVKQIDDDTFLHKAPVLTS
jgi:hypothetical protein